MGTSEWLQLAAVVLGAPAATYYPIMFLRVQWFRTDIGWSMVVKGSALASVFWVAIISFVAYRRHLDWWDAISWARAASDWLLALAVWLQVVVMTRVQREGSMRDRMAGHKPGRRADRTLD